MTRGFKYETLLRIRRRQEDIRALSLAAARMEVENARTQRNQLITEQQRSMTTASTMLHDRVNPGVMRIYAQYERYLSRMIDEKDADIESLEVVAEERRQELEEASKARHVMDKLKERMTAAQLKHELYLEQRFLDEVATNYAALGDIQNADEERG